MPIQNVPSAEEVGEVLRGLLGRDVTVTKEGPDSLDVAAKVVAGLYEREDLKVGAVAVADLELAAYAGAALALIPKGMADENIGDGVIEDMLLENFQEVLNVGVRWFTAKMNPRVVLSEVYIPGGPRPPDDVAVVMSRPAERADFLCDIVGYGKGRLRLMVTEY